MSKENASTIHPYQKRKHVRRIWKRAVWILGCLVVFCTVYTLILPAITADYKCGMEEHTHSLACYRQVIPENSRKLTCSAQSLDIHSHSPSCYDADGNLICGYADYVIHTHDESCYDADGVLVCPLPQMQEHIHTESCYDTDSNGESVLTCGIPQVQPHVHSTSCYDETGKCICGKLETYEHTHSAYCFSEEEQPLTCTLPEDENHTHTELCYGEWELICGLPEHIHTEECCKEQPKLPEGSETSQDTSIPSDPVEPPLMEESTVPEDSTEPSKPEDTSAVSSIPLELDNYIMSAKLMYKLQDESSWHDIAGAAIPGNAQLRLEAKYGKIPIQKLMNHGNQLTYVLPELLRNPTAKGEILDENRNGIGKITISGNVLTLTFYDEWLQKLKEQGSTEISGSFNVESTVNISSIPDGGNIELVIGTVIIKPTFETDLIVKYGNAEVKKTVSNTVIRENKQDYLQYTLTLTAGPDGCKDVKVVDSFSTNRHLVTYDSLNTASTPLSDAGFPRETIAAGCSHGSVYKGASPTAENPIPAPESFNGTEPGSLVWFAGDMQPNEVRTLTYRVKLLEGYTRLQNRRDKIIQNDANCYSGTEKRSSSTAHFEPKAGLNMHKSHSGAVRNAQDGSYTITYTVWIEAFKTNKFILDNVRIVDSLQHQSDTTDHDALPFITYMPDSFHLYRGKTPSGTELSINGSDGSIPKLEYGTDSKEFTLWVGDMKAGDTYCLQYQVRVGVEAFGAIDGENLLVRNRAIVYSDNAGRFDGSNELQAYTNDANIEYNHWVKKTVGSRIEQEINVPLTAGAVYDATSEPPVVENSPPPNFTVPVGSYRYTVAVNDLGDWDVSKAYFHDQLQSNYMQYVGYARIDAYDPKDKEHDVPEHPLETRWVKVDQLSEFKFTMASIGLTHPTYAYQLTYYAVPVNIDGISSVEITNSFRLRNIVSVGSYTAILTGIQSRASVIVHGGASFEAIKHPWHYEGAQTSTGPWANGALYWVIQVNGTNFQSGIQLKDHVDKNSQMVFYEDSLIGIYKGSFPEGNSFTDYANIDAVKASGHVTEIPTSAYTVSFQNSQNLPGNQANSDVIIKMEQTVELGSENSLYIVLKVSPTVLPEENRTSKTYINFLSSSDNGSHWVQRDEASKILYGGENILKELEKTFTYDGTNIKDIDAIKISNILKQHLKEPGYYASWTVKVNYAGTLSGRYRIVEQVPEGMEMAYTRLKWLGEKTQNLGTCMCQIPDYQTALGAEWTEHVLTANTDRGNSVTSYYYTNGNQVLWEVDNLVAGNEKDNFSADFQVVCRVTDPDVLLGGKKATFNNYVELQTDQGIALDSDSNGITFQISTMNKKAIPAGSTIPFTIELNPLGEDLAAGSDALVLVDEMSETLRLNPTTIKVVRTKDKTEVAFNASLYNHALWITLPDNEPLTVSYTADVVAAPGETVSISNNAYWQGYTSTGKSRVEIKSYSYTVDATAGGDKTPTLSVEKIDQYDLTQHLSGAEFELQKGTMENGVFTPIDEPQIQTTDRDGIANFGISPDLLSYNTVYRITEKKTPKGYVLDPTPHYVIVAKQNEDETYPTYPEGVEVHYDSSHVVLNLSNHKGEAYVEKEFQDMSGNPMNSIDGTYRFAIYKDADASTKPLQTIELTFKDGTTSPIGTFINLNLDQPYYIYELDDAGNPIRDQNTAIADSSRFTVTYASSHAEGGNVVNSGDTVTVTNRLCTENLPKTGGHGKIPYILSGLVLICSSAWILYKKGRHGREVH